MLVLLKTNDWVAGSARPLHSPGPDESGNTELIAVLPNGPLRMGYGSRHKLGVLNNPTRRLVPLTEIRFEATPESVGGALIFSASGDLIGSLNATLVGPDSTIRNVSGNNIAPGGGGFGGARGGPGGNQGVGNFGQASQIGNSMRGGQYGNVGPNEMTVAYTVSPDFVKHVLEGFLSPAHSAEFAVLGIFCTDAIGGGAQIQSVTPGSPASKAGLHPGDVLLNIASNPIQDQMAFAAVMLQQKVGKKISLVVQRGPGKLLIDVVPARAAD